MLVNRCYISWGMGIRKVSESKSDLRGHSRSLVSVPFNGPHTIFYLLVHCFPAIISYFAKIKQVTWRWTQSNWG